ncbi:MAG: hypothetical protein KDA89_07550, partial [Planctomycetaceae bacterium]|nr:hypothetical protein [Planctomycetaceae bacterium]
MPIPSVAAPDNELPKAGSRDTNSATAARDAGNSSQASRGTVPTRRTAPTASASAESARQPASAPRRPAAGGDPTTEVVSGSGEYFDYTISQRPDFAMVTVNLEEGQQVFAEPSAMAAMTP